MKLDAAGARAGIEAQLAQPLGLSVEDAARAIIDIAVSKMSLAVREVSVQQGHDPRDFALVCSGGAGPLHAVAVARDLKIPTVIVPWYPSHFSALGMLLADERHNLVRTYLARVDVADFAAIRAISRELEREARALTRGRDPVATLSFDLRYVGQEFSLNIPVSGGQLEAGDGAGIRAAFDALHEQRYAHHAADEPVEIINIRLAVHSRGARPAIPAPKGGAVPPRHREVFFARGGAVRCPVYDREQLAPGTAIAGPALIQEFGTTTVVHPQDSAQVAPSGEIIISLGE
jgi:N-methylhydantoinase A